MRLKATREPIINLHSFFCCMPKRPIKSTKEREESKGTEEEISEAVRSTGLRLSWIKFIDAYIQNGGNGTEAYLTAYPESSKEAARRSASDLLTKPDILEEINNRLVTQKVTDEFIYSNLVNLVNTHWAGKGSLTAVKALEILAKMKGLLVDTKRIAFTGDNPAVFPALVKDTTKKEMDEKVARGERISE